MGVGLLADRFELVRELGAGGCGVVWLARDIVLERFVALKRVSVVDDGDGNERFGAVTVRAGDTPPALRDALAEARATARLNHPGVVSLFEVVVEPEAMWLVAEFVDGPTLDEALSAGELSDRAIADVGISVCHALMHAHRVGVVHRDVKPANILLPPEGEAAKLADFGIAAVRRQAALDAESHDQQTDEFDVDTGGTAGYMSPEQCAGEGAGPATDVYSLGLVLYESFAGYNPAAQARAKRNVFAPLAASRPDLPPGLTETVDAALSVDPVFRPPPEELAAELQAVLPELSDDIPVGSSTGPVGELVYSWVGRMALGASVAIGVAMTAVALRLTVPVELVVGCFVLVASFPVAGSMLSVGVGTAMLAVPEFQTGRGGAALIFAVALAAGLLLLAATGPRPHRALLGGLAFFWAAMWELATGHTLIFGGPDGLVSANRRMRSPEQAFSAIVELLTTPYLSVALLWAALALLLPWFVRGEDVVVRSFGAGLWIAAAVGGHIALGQSLSEYVVEPNSIWIYVVAGVVGALATVVGRVDGEVEQTFAPKVLR